LSYRGTGFIITQFQMWRDRRRRRSDGRKRKPSLRAWEMTYGEDGAPPAERQFVPPVILVHDDDDVFQILDEVVHDDEHADGEQNAA